MSIEQNKQLVRRYYLEVVNEAKVDELSDYLSSDYVEVHTLASVRSEARVTG